MVSPSEGSKLIMVTVAPEEATDPSKVTVSMAESSPRSRSTVAVDEAPLSRAVPKVRASHCLSHRCRQSNCWMSLQQRYHQKRECYRHPRTYRRSPHRYRWRNCRQMSGCLHLIHLCRKRTRWSWRHSFQQQTCCCHPRTCRMLQSRRMPPNSRQMSGCRHLIHPCRKWTRWNWQRWIQPQTCCCHPRTY